MHRLRELVTEAPRQLRQGNILLLAVTGALILVGLLFIYGVGQRTGGHISGYWLRQLRFVLIGGTAMVGLAAVDYQWLQRQAWLVYLGSLAALVAVLLVGTKVNGARSWLNVGINIQPGEAAKLGVIVILAHWLSRGAFRPDRLRDVAGAVGLAMAPLLLIALQPDFGSALVFVPIVVAMLFAAGLRVKWLVYVALVATIAAPLFYAFVLSPHQKQRLGIFVQPLAEPVLAHAAMPDTWEEGLRDHFYLHPDPRSGGWNARQSLLAVGSGGVVGKGFMNGTQNTLGFLPRPVAPTDFIFSVIAEETGFLGSCLLLGLFAALLLLAIFVAARARDDFGRFLAVGIAALFAVHIFVNIGMTMGVMPIIGIPLPFVSYGGSFLLVMLACIGILQSVYIRRQTW